MECERLGSEAPQCRIAHNDSSGVVTGGHTCRFSQYKCVNFRLHQRNGVTGNDSNTERVRGSFDDAIWQTDLGGICIECVYRLQRDFRLRAYGYNQCIVNVSGIGKGDLSDSHERSVGDIVVWPLIALTLADGSIVFNATEPCRSTIGIAYGCACRSIAECGADG